MALLKLFIIREKLDIGCKHLVPFLPWRLFSISKEPHGLNWTVKNEPKQAGKYFSNSIPPTKFALCLLVFVKCHQPLHIDHLLPYRTA